ncbi:MAG: MBG domain-containing protein [Verrucomicrobiota bacterium]
MNPQYQAFTQTGAGHSGGFIRLLVTSIAMVSAGISMAAQVTLSNLAQIYSGSQKSATVVTSPVGLNYSITYAGSTTPPTNAGSYAVVATVVDPVETGSASGTLVISKASQTITMGEFAEKTYGNEPFTVAATANSGLPVTKWESSDPSVASITSSGLVTLLGAGQTSIIASNTGNTNYNAAWIARPLNVARSLAPLPTGVQTVTYNGTAQGLDPGALPSGQATEISYRDTQFAEAAATPEVVFQNGPDTLDLSYLSTGFQAVGYWSLAKYASLGGTARKLDSCDVTLVSWARYDTSSPNGYLPWANAHPELVIPPKPGISVPGDSGGYYHPVTLSFYEYENDGVIESYRLLTSQTTQTLIPWRPSTLADGVTPYPANTNGTAFRVSFSFPDGVILPPNVWVVVSYNTSSFGQVPVGVPGPYDSLNIARPSGQQAGSTLLPSSTLLYKDWRWQSSSGSNGPMLSLRAIPTNATTVAPLNAATYEVKTKPAAFGTDARSTSMLVINKAPLEVNLSNLTQIRDGNPKPVTVSTVPGGIVTSVTYAGFPVAVVPSALGKYPVTATSANPNYEGQASGTLHIGDSYSSWQTATFAGSGLPPEKITDTADPDDDGLSNFLEYAFNLNPITGDNSSPVGFGYSGNTLTFTYRRNLHALDLDYAIQDTTDLADPLSWSLVTPLSQAIESDDGSTRVITATVAEPTGQPRYFMRLQTTR